MTVEHRLQRCSYSTTWFTVCTFKGPMWTSSVSMRHPIYLSPRLWQSYFTAESSSFGTRLAAIPHAPMSQQASRTVMPEETKHQFYEHTEGSDVGGDQQKAKTPQGVILIPKPSSDPHDPLNWPLSKKLLTLGIVSFASCINLGQSLANQAGLVPQAALYHVSPVEVSYSVSDPVSRGRLCGRS